MYNLDLNTLFPEYQSESIHDHYYIKKKITL